MLKRGRRKTMRKLVTASVAVTVFREGDYMVAYCRALELSSYGRTVDDAKHGFEDAIRIFFDDAEMKGTLERELLSLGWTLRQKPECDYRPPSFGSDSVPAAMRARPVVKKYAERVRIPC
jgi:predicted RNase H-like HicB family nuclease